MDVVGTSLGLAGNILHLVVFSIEFVSDVKQVYRKGATDSNIDLAIVASSIQSATKSLEAQLEEAGKKQETEESELDPDEKELRMLAVRAAEIGRELAADLNKVTTEQKSKWKSLKTAARGMWDAGDIEKVEKRLHAIREELQLRYLTEIKKKVDKLGNGSQHRMLNTLERIASAQGESTLERKEILQLLIEMESASSTRHDTLIRLQEQLVAGINALSNSKSSSSVPLQDLSDDTQARERAYNAILSSLWYPTIRDREDSIRDAYAKTFDWLYHDPKSTRKPWDSFVDFLQGDIRSYWITGKPGSGKSTLMKYLRKDPRTRQHLNPWVAGKELLESSFYFYYSGSDMQKSEHGLVLSLLHGLLEQKRDLITTAFEERFRHILLQGKGNLDKPTLQEAKKALRRLFERQTDIAFFLTVDGLDEFDPKVSTTDVESLLEFGRSLEEFPNVKIVFASRPLNHFEEAFADCPHLRMHDLTYEDIRMYVNERLEKHKLMQSLLDRDPENARDLVISIVKSSSGVFLWVRLVIDSLIDGLRNYDGIQDLQRRVNELPTDLYDLYEVMLSRIPASYRPQTKKLLKIVLLNTSTFNLELSVIGLRFAEEATDEMVVKTPIDPVKDQDLKYYYKEMERRLKSRCLDLVEIRPSDSTQQSLAEMVDEPRTDIYDIANTFINARVTFLHRSVNEFLKQYNWATFSEVDEPYSGLSLSLLRSAIMMLKIYRFDHENSWPILLRMASYAGKRAQIAEGMTKKPSSTLLHVLDITMTNHLMKLRAMPGENLGIPEIFKMDPGVNSHWSAWHDTVTMLDDVNVDRIWKSPKDLQSGFASFATAHELLYYLKEQATANGPDSLRKPGLSLLGHALFHPLPWQDPLKFPWFGGTEFLLGIGFEHTEIFEGASLWTWVFRLVPSATVVSNDFSMPIWTFFSYIETMILLLNRGACTNERLIWPLEILQEEGNESDNELSLLRGARRALRLCETEPKLKTKDTSPLKQLITILQERGAIEQGWKDGVLVYPPTSESNTDVLIEGKSEESTNMPDTSADLGREDAPPIPQIATETSENINAKAFDGENSENGAQDATRPSWNVDAKRPGKKDVKPALQAPTPSKHRKSLSLWLRRFSGRSRSVPRE